MVKEMLGAYETVPVPRIAVRFPLEIPPPLGFAPDRPETWPVVEGQLEFYEGKLFSLPGLAPTLDELLEQLSGG